MSYDLWTRWDRVACRVAGHAWLDHQCEWLGGAAEFSPAQSSTCVRCGASGVRPSRGRPRLART